MFLTDNDIRKFGIHMSEDDIKPSSLNLHVSKTYDSNDGPKDIKGRGFPMGGFEYPRHMTFVTEEKITLDKSTIGLIFGRQTHALQNVLVFPGLVHPTFSGYLLLQVVCLSGKAIIEKGDPIAYITFAKTGSDNEKTVDNEQRNRKLGL
ncbi:MAG: hypothetical protein E4G94_10455 [ANME-2 cluster archaeon]|nr:MAG: hypothetical protein E4G94_10455 [ANME-2 cluster archaeon]